MVEYTGAESLELHLGCESHCVDLWRQLGLLCVLVSPLVKYDLQ